MTIEDRLTRLECQVRGLISMTGIDRQNNKYDVDGVRKATSDLTPVTMTEKGYIQDKAVRFVDVPKGNVTVFCEVPYTLYQPDGCNWLEVRFDEPLTKVIEVTISIL